VKIFISWSGAKSRAVAAALRQWIPDIIQSVEPWMSEVDVDAGSRWGRNVEDELKETKFGILCLTKSNLNAPWILFEAGALAKTIEDTFVCPYLVDLIPTDIPAGPLSQFQAKKANQNETWELILAINKALKDESLPEDKLRRTFDRWWPDLKGTLDNLPDEPETAESPRSEGSMLEEILGIVRTLSRKAATQPSIILLMEGLTDRKVINKMLEEQVSNDPEKTKKLKTLLTYIDAWRPYVRYLEHIYPHYWIGHGDSTTKEEGTKADTEKPAEGNESAKEED